ncbi:hypothetical protein J4464_07050 [Candidatus Woesearchaeota archaeon]|nr:hypothetical protein [Candidatus Woesearchaeota archaeon]
MSVPGAVQSALTEEEALLLRILQLAKSGLDAPKLTVSAASLHDLIDRVRYVLPGDVPDYLECFSDPSRIASALEHLAAEGALHNGNGVYETADLLMHLEGSQYLNGPYSAGLKAVLPEWLDANTSPRP